MAAKTISIDFDGYWRDVNRGSIPNRSGVYCVYECAKDATTGNFAIHKLIYIGESENVRERIDKHEKRPDWLKHVRKGNELCFSGGAVGGNDRLRGEAAMIFKHKPPVNVEFVNAFPFDQTTMALSGKTSFLTTNFTVPRT